MKFKLKVCSITEGTTNKSSQIFQTTYTEFLKKLSYASLNLIVGELHGLALQKQQKFIKNRRRRNYL